MIVNNFNVNPRIDISKNVSFFKRLPFVFNPFWNPFIQLHKNLQLRYNFKVIITAEAKMFANTKHEATLAAKMNRLTLFVWSQSQFIEL